MAPLTDRRLSLSFTLSVFVVSELRGLLSQKRKPTAHCIDSAATNPRGRASSNHNTQYFNTVIYRVIVMNLTSANYACSTASGELLTDEAFSPRYFLLEA